MTQKEALNKILDVLVNMACGVNIDIVNEVIADKYVLACEIGGDEAAVAEAIAYVRMGLKLGPIE